MPKQPSRTEYEIGPDKYQRRTLLVGENQGGVVVWSIVSEPVNQRDDGELIRSLTTPQLVAIGEIAEQLSRKRGS
jgi:hypothetical protein